MEDSDAYLREIGEMTAAAKMKILRQVALDLLSFSFRNVPVRLFAFATLLVLLAPGCASRPPSSVDPAARLLVPGEPIRLRVPADLMHGHDMEEPPYGDQGYAPIPTYPGELLLTDRRILFVVRSAAPEASWVSIPYAAIARARPSRTPLLNYIVVWDPEGHADSFVVDARFVQALHRKVGEALMARGSLPPAPVLFGHFSP